MKSQLKQRALSSCRLSESSISLIVFTQSRSNQIFRAKLCDNRISSNNESVSYLKTLTLFSTHPNQEEGDVFNSECMKVACLYFLLKLVNCTHFWVQGHNKVCVPGANSGSKRWPLGCLSQNLRIFSLKNPWNREKNCLDGGGGAFARPPTSATVDDGRQTFPSSPWIAHILGDVCT